MGSKLNEVGVVILSSIAEQFREMAEKLTSTAVGIEKRERKSMPLPWSQRHYDCLDAIETAVNLIESTAKTAFKAIDQQRSIPQERTLARRETEKRPPDSPPKKKRSK